MEAIKAETIFVPPRSQPHLTCPNCSAGLVEISFPAAESVTHMRSCSRCHSRFWWREGKLVDLPTALAAMAMRRLRHRRSA